MDVHARLRQLLDERGWSEYKLSKMSGLSEATVSNVYRRNTVPSIPTLEQICNGFGITLSQFFCEEDMVELAPELAEALMSLVDPASVKRVTGSDIFSAMKSLGYGGERYIEGRMVKTVSEDGLRHGLRMGQRISRSGGAYEDLYYDQDAQRMIVESYVAEPEP